MQINFFLFFTYVFFILVLTVDNSHSTQLSSEECFKAKVELKALVDGGIPEDIAKGYKIASPNLSKDRLLKIKRWFELQEQILFRCPKTKNLKSDAIPNKDTSPNKDTIKASNGDRKSVSSPKTDAKVPQTQSIKKAT